MGITLNGTLMHLTIKYGQWIFLPGDKMNLVHYYNLPFQDIFLHMKYELLGPLEKFLKRFHCILPSKKVQKVKSLVLIKHHTTKRCGVDVQLHSFLTSALDRGEGSVLSPVCFTPRERVPSTHWTGSWIW
jgi:hypothetical protein